MPARGAMNGPSSVNLQTGCFLLVSPASNEDDGPGPTHLHRHDRPPPERSSPRDPWIYETIGETC